MKRVKLAICLVVVCSVILMLMNQASSQAANISLVSSTVTVGGSAKDGTYSGENSGGCTGYGYDGSTWSASSSGYMSTGGAGLNANCVLVAGYGDSWNLDHVSSYVNLTSVFQPQSSNLTFEFTGSTGDHNWESFCDYALTDLTTNTLIEDRHWAWDMGWGWVGGDSLPYTANYMFDLGHEYQLTLSANSGVGDHREGYANLQLSITPEPATLLLLGLGAVIVRKRHR